jgi:hypothetical protein
MLHPQTLRRGVLHRRDKKVYAGGGVNWTILMYGTIILGIETINIPNVLQTISK